MNKINYIQQLKKLPQRFFPQDWVEKENWNTDENSKKSYLRCKKKLDDFTDQSLYFLSMSLLSGEFVIQGVIVDSVITYLLDIFTKEYGSPTEEKNKYKQEILSSFQDLGHNLKSVCLDYRSVNSYYPEHFKQVKHNYTFQVYRNEEAGDSSNKLNNFSNLVLPVCLGDLYFSYFEKSAVDNLLFLVEELKKSNEKESSKQIQQVYQLCIEKGNFLLKKLLFLFGPFEYSINFKDYSKSASDIKIQYLQTLAKRFEIFANNASQDSSTIHKYEERAYTKKAYFSEMILMMRYYCKNSDGTSEQIKNLLDEFNIRYKRLYNKKITNEFDLNALNSIWNVMHNCRLSFVSSQKKYTVDDLQKDMDEIISFQNRKCSYNYFHYQIGIEFLISKAKGNSYNGENEKKELQRTKDLLEEYIKHYKKCLEWCSRNSFYPLQLMYNECCIGIKEFNTNLFIPSTFSQPIDYEKLENKEKEYEIDLLLIDSKIELADEKEKIQKIKESVEQTTSKFVEIGGTFVAILSLLFGVISFSSNTQKLSFEQLIIHSLGVGLILLIFSASIYILTLRKSEIWYKSIRFWFFFCVMVGSIIATAILVYHIHI
jgi:hypothetical protein